MRASTLDLERDADIVLFDVADKATQRSVGRQLARLRSDRGLFVVGSSGIEYALLSRMGARRPDPRRNSLRRARPRRPHRSRLRQLLADHRSANPHARRERLRRVRGRSPASCLGETPRPSSRRSRWGLASLKLGRSVVLYTALGPETDIGDQFESEGARHAIGRALGRIERALIEQAGLRRAVIAGGDTSSHALRELGVYALTTRLPLPTTPGSPLCLAHSEEKPFDGLRDRPQGRPGRRRRLFREDQAGSGLV